MKVVLELQDQPANVRRVMVRHDIVIGRGSDCNLRLSAPQVSRRHCFLRVGREGVSITDLDSSNGTFVDGKRIKSGKRHDLVDGASLSLGPIRFLIHIREKAVSADILKSGNLDEVKRTAAANQATDNSTVVGNASAVVADGHRALSPPLDISIEQAGESAEANESTIGDLIDPPYPPVEPIRSRTTNPELSDSRAEIIDLGRRMAEPEVIEIDEDIEVVEEWVDAEPIADAEIHEVYEVDSAVEVDVLDVVEVLDVEDIMLTDDITEFEEIEVIPDADVAIATDADGIETIPEVSETESDGNWFEDASKDDDDIDPNLQSFLKGL